MNIDLHSHTTASDGTYSPSELMTLVKLAGVDTFAITDHDTIAGFELAKPIAHELNIRLISGVEISTQHLMVGGGYGTHQKIDKSIHVVGLNFSDTTQMATALHATQQARAERGLAMVKKMAEILSSDAYVFERFDNDLSRLIDKLWAGVLAKTDGNGQSVGRPHIAQVLCDWGVVGTVSQAFDKYLGDTKPAYVALETFTIEQAVKLIHDCGGLAVLAHPTRYKLSATRIRRLIGEFAELGGDACELPAISEPASNRTMIDREIAKHGLMVSVGSDFHGTTTPWRKLGQVAKIGRGQTGVWQQF